MLNNQEYFDKKQEKLKRKEEKEIIRTLKKAKVPKYADQKVTEDKLIEYASKASLLKFYEMKFSKELLNNPEFVKRLYQSNTFAFDRFPPSRLNPEFTKDIDFMVNYLKSALKASNWKTLRIFLDDYDNLIESKEFLQRIPTDFPRVVISELIKDTFEHKTDFNNNKDEYLKKQKQILESLPIELLCDQAREFGSRAISNIPKDLKGFKEIVSAGIENDKFNSLEQLDINDIINSKDLIMKSAKLTSEGELVRYIIHGLSPNRNKYYMCHGELHSYDYYDENYARVQEALVNDKDIREILMKYTIKKVVKSEYVLDKEDTDNTSCI